MPSAEKSSSAAVKLESVQQNEAKMMENVQKEGSESSPLFCLNQIVSMISNKVRNLEKRKNKLDGYMKEEEDGRELSAEQRRAISKYDEVTQQLILAKEFSKQFSDMAKNASKEAKREARNAVFSRQAQEKSKVRDVLMIQDLLQRLKDVNVRNDFLNERNGACLVSPNEMNFIDEFAQKVVPQRPSMTSEQTFDNTAKVSAEYFCFVVDGRTKEFLETGLTYEKGRELFNRIQSCGYWEKDVKVVEQEAAPLHVDEISRADTGTPNSEDMIVTRETLPTDDRIPCVVIHQQRVAHQQMLPVNPPAPNQVPTPSFNGNFNKHHRMAMEQQQQQASMARIPAPMNMKTTVTAVESQYFNQMKLSQQQHQTIGNVLPAVVPPPSEFSSSFSFLQDSELEVQQKPQKKQHGSQSQPPKQQKTVNVVQQNTQQQQQQVNTAPIPSNFSPSQMYPPPGLKVQPTHIPVNFQKQQSTQVPPHMIPASIEQQQKQHQPTTRPAYPPALVPTQVQTFTNVKSIEQQLHQQQQLQQQQQHHQQPVKAKHDGPVDGIEGMTAHHDVIEKSSHSKDHDDFQQQPQIGTWTNETATQAGNGNGHTGNIAFPARSGGFSRSHRSSGGEKKFNNYRNRGQENGVVDHQQPAGGTFFRNNERYNGGNAGNSNSNGNGNGRYENRGGSTGHTYKPREGNHRAGSGRFPSNSTAMPMASQAAPRK